jgi:predicted enzyme involved in methoxymalonyl-ACP biosynthesis
VFGRGAESFILAALANLARQQGATALLGEFVAGKRNAVIEKLYSRLGFSRHSDDGRWWRRELSVPLDDQSSFIANAGSPL